MVELMSLNLASLQVNGADVLTTTSTISWNQITDVPTEVLESSDTLSDLNCLDGENYNEQWWCMGVLSLPSIVIDADGMVL